MMCDKWLLLFKAKIQIRNLATYVCMEENVFGAKKNKTVVLFVVFLLSLSVHFHVVKYIETAALDRLINRLVD